MRVLFEIIYLTPLIICIIWFIAIMVTFIKPENRFKIPLLIFFLNSILALTMSNLYERGLYNSFLDLYIPAVFSALSMFPLYYIYIKKLVSQDEYKFNYWYKHLVIPFAAMLIAAISLYGFATPDNRMLWIRNLVLEDMRIDRSYYYLNIQDSILRKLFLILSVAYFYLTVRTINNYKSTIKQFFSNDDDVSLPWFTTFKYSYYLTIVAAFAYFTLGRYATSQTVVLPVISHFLLSIFFWNIGYHGKQQKKVYSQLNMLTVSDVKQVYEKIGIEQKLCEQIDEKQIYCDQNITLAKLALLIGTNKSYLSRYINQELNSNFSDYINKKRVDHAAGLLLHNDKNIYEVCELSGFNSLSSFYRAFKKFKGTTPNRFQDDDPANAG
jgi:AraC-like DNA-binding protein